MIALRLDAAVLPPCVIASRTNTDALPPRMIVRRAHAAAVPPPVIALRTDAAAPPSPVTLAVMRARHGAAAAEAFRSATGGRPLHEVFDEPAGDQVAIFDRAFSVLEGRADVSLPEERLATLKTLNDTLRAAVIASDAAGADRAVKSLKVAASEKEFVARYRKLLRLATLTLGEEVVLAHFPQLGE